MDERQSEPQAPVAANLREVSEGIARLVREHVELAKLEVQANVKKAGRDISLTAAGAGLLLLGWTLLMVAIGFWIGDAIGDGWGFFIVAAVHVVIGGALAGVFAQRLRTKDKPKLHDTTVEIERDRHFLHRVGELIREQPRGMRPA